MSNLACRVHRSVAEPANILMFVSNQLIKKIFLRYGDAKRGRPFMPLSDVADTLNLYESEFWLGGISRCTPGLRMRA